MTENNFEKGQQVILNLDSLAFGGDSVGRKDGMVFFVPEGAPGDKVEVEITYLSGNFGRGIITKILEASPYRVTPPCSLHGICGGCGLQHLTYEYQLESKRKTVEDCISRIGGLENVEVLPVLGMEDPWRYRNKVQAPFGGGLDPYLGLYAKGSHRVIRLDDCLIQPEVNNRVLLEAARLAKKYRWPAYKEEIRKGILRYLLSRTESKSGKVQVVLVSMEKEPKGRYKFAKELHDAVPEVSGVWLNYNARRDNVVLGENYFLLAGDEFLEEDIGGIEYLLSPGSFFQVNPVQAGSMVSLILEEAALCGREKVLDIYCGAGTFSLHLARRCERVTGIEESGHAVEDAERNAIHNNIENVEFIKGKAEDVIGGLPEKHYDLVVLDPPRKGCAREVLKAVGEDGVPEIVYISCNPSTLARDLKILSGMGYKTRKIRPVDMFPHTPHIECIAFLERAD
ncbi:MAG: 23S rRNA (uracil(1939)-C(5))-methyltransferase RlmD [Chloroflexi bacterium]|nr:23S rRNA (uracil(1939)-C(5))-methyltransferase RlmD [Chloroflexota bacterium]